VMLLNYRERFLEAASAARPWCCESGGGLRAGSTLFSVTTHLFAATSLTAARLSVWYSLAVGSGRLDRASNHVFALPI